MKGFLHTCVLLSASLTVVVGCSASPSQAGIPTNVATPGASPTAAVTSASTAGAGPTPIVQPPPAATAPIAPTTGPTPPRSVGAPSPPSAVATSTSTLTSGSVPVGADNAVNAAIADLTKRAAVEASSIRVLNAEATEWSDSSLGCPQPDKFYAQVITPGYRIILEAGGKRYEYHTDRGSSVVRCP